MERIRLSYSEAILYITLFNMGLGILFGLIPLILGFYKNNRKYGVFGFFCSIVGGAILGVILSIPAAAIFSWLILRSSKPVEAAVVDEKPVDVSIKNSENP
ncbi:hypothetical protein BH24ACI2_BH24ACI2_11410 [soil metagenome]|jgi:hypothetical protein|nr:hypothetical protein [Acidobacteriota bacterium]